MTRRVVVLIPFRPDPSGWRSLAFEAASAQASELGWPVYVGDSGDQPFSIARTWNRLAAEADQDGRWDVAVRWAADVLIEDPDSVRAAVDQVDHYTVPFDRTTRLSESETRTYYQTWMYRPRDDPVAYGGITVITRELWDRVGGYDPRFVGYGAEDYAFVHGVEVLFGPRQRVPGRQVMLWHPSARRHRATTSTDPYWLRRTANLALFRDEIAPITTPAGWATYLANRPKS